jgi:hypothetical protein
MTVTTYQDYVRPTMTHTEGRGKVYLRFSGGSTLAPYPYVSSPREQRNGVACHEFSTSKSDRVRLRGTKGRAVIWP